MGLGKYIRTAYVKIGRIILGGYILDGNYLLGQMSQDWLEHVNLSFSQEAEDLILYRLICHKSSGFYIDVGAHHPYRFSNTFKFYLLGWRGINIDPLPGSKLLFDKSRPRDLNIEAAVMKNRKEPLMYYMFNEPALNTFDSGLAAERDGTRGYHIIEKKYIKSLQLDELFDEYLPPNTQIDFLTIDAEGMDMEILMTNNWMLYRPGYIVIESLGTSLVEDLHSPAVSYLTEQNYVLLAKTANSLFFKENTKTQ